MSYFGINAQKRLGASTANINFRVSTAITAELSFNLTLRPDATNDC
jgi:hypothetical protein